MLILSFSVLVAILYWTPKTKTREVSSLFLFFSRFYLRMEGEESQGTWVAWLVKRPTLDFSSGHDFGAMGLSPALGFMPSVESA